MTRHQNRPRHPWVQIVERNTTALPYWPIHWGRYGHSKINSIVKELHQIFFMFFEKSRRLLFYRHVFSLPLPVSYWSRLNQECGKPASSHKGDRAAGIRKSTFLKKNIWEGEEVATSRMSYVWITEHPKHMAKNKSVQREREPCNFIPGSYIFRFFILQTCSRIRLITSFSVCVSLMIDAG